MKNLTIKKKKKEPRVLSVFDFDGTLTHHDSFILFLYFSFRKYHFFRQLFSMALPTLYYVSQRLTRDELKSMLIKTFLIGIDEDWLYQKADKFCEKYWEKLIRPSGTIAVAKELKEGAEVTICSASPTFLLRPWANRLGIKLIATELEVLNGKFSGGIVGENCRCKQKIIRLEEIYGDLGQYHLRAWGDTIGDRELLAIAQDPHWRNFHPFYSRYFSFGK